MNRTTLTTFEIIRIIITFFFLLYGAYLLALANDPKSGRVLIFMSLISFSLMFIKKRIKF
jgi:hypothetical protein